MSQEAPVVRFENVTRRYGTKIALDGVDLALQPGTVMGLVGANGAGKTTLIKHILGLLKPDAGSVRVFGRDPVADPVGVLAQVGYLSEEDTLPGWMSVRDLQRYLRSFYPAWDQSYAERLREEFGLAAHARLRSLSKGQRARAGLMAALAYRPRLLVLDEPSSGLDPIVRRDILSAIIRTIADEGRTVLFSSHLLTEVERVADEVAMIRNGRLVFCESLDAVKESHLAVTLRFPAPRSEPPAVSGAITWQGSGREWSALYRGSLGAAEAAATVQGADVVDRRGVSLDEIFVAYAEQPGDGA
jgi:ABC-2 type transport system ATP-binding protein